MWSSDEEDSDHLEDHQEILEGQMDDIERQFQARLQEQVKSAADACQVSAERVKELSKVGALMLAGDNPAPTEMTAEVLKEIATLCLSANQKAVLEGNVLQWCSVRLLKESWTVQIMIQVGAFMQDDLALWATGISLTCPLVVKISLDQQDFSRPVRPGSYRVSAYQEGLEHENNPDTRCSIALTYFIPFVVTQYLENWSETSSSTGPEENWSDQGLLIGVMKHLVHSLMYLKYNCVICKEKHMDFRYTSSLFPRPCSKTGCTDLKIGCTDFFAMWIELAPKKTVTVASLKTWLQKKYKPNNARDVKVLDNELKRFGVYYSHITFHQMVDMLAMMISWRAAESPWVQVLADVVTENTQEENIEEATPQQSATQSRPVDVLTPAVLLQPIRTSPGEHFSPMLPVAAPSESLARVSETHDDASSSGPEHQNSRLNVANEEEDAAHLIPDPLVLEPHEVNKLTSFFKLFFKFKSVKKHT
ncbi:unnamed protein product [Sphagnum jensenii]|uniref:Uncharacterized protein n=1 Tax=Sphagnum jensenii TaxID=128206 RepID=A0ABP0WJT2_9BRYO